MTENRLDPPDVTVITGAAGWLGTGLVHAFADGGTWARPGSLIGLVHSTDSTAQLPAPFQTVFGDITDERGVETIFADLPGSGPIDVIHTAGVIHPSRVSDFDRINHQGTRNVLGAAERRGVRRFVHVSSNSPFGTNGARTDHFRNTEPYHPYLGYGRSKMDAEVAVFEAADRGVDAVIVRPPWFYGPHQPARQTTFFSMVRSGRFPILGDGGQRRSMTYIDNLVQGIALAELTPTEPGKAWWIADARPYSVGEIVETVGDALRSEGFDVSPSRVRLPDVVGQVAETLDRGLQRVGRYNQQIHVLGEMNKTIAVDISAARNDLGFDPEVGLHDGMRRSIRWCVDSGIEL
jgi:nucleoside-diphosphate-sugar epimerase